MNEIDLDLERRKVYQPNEKVLQNLEDLEDLLAFDKEYEKWKGREPTKLEIWLSKKKPEWKKKHAHRIAGMDLECTLCGKDFLKDDSFRRILPLLSFNRNWYPFTRYFCNSACLNDWAYFLQSLELLDNPDDEVEFVFDLDNDFAFCYNDFPPHCLKCNAILVTGDFCEDCNPVDEEVEQT